MTSHSNILYSVIIAICSILIVLLGITIVLIATGNVFIGNVVGESMEPTLSEGDVFIYTDTIRPEKSDIIVFEQETPSSNSDLIVHRVHKIQTDTYITKGDNNTYTDPPIDKSKYEGTVIVYFPRNSVMPHVAT